MKVEYQIQLANITKISIQNFNKMMYNFQYLELIVLLIHNGDEVEASIPGLLC